jgi:hypothetical protein
MLRFWIIIGTGKLNIRCNRVTEPTSSLVSGLLVRNVRRREKTLRAVFVVTQLKMSCHLSLLRL